MGEIPITFLKTSIPDITKVIRSWSQALGVSRSPFSSLRLGILKNGKFEVNKKILMEVLDFGTSNEIIATLKFLGTEIINVSMADRMELWHLIKSRVDLEQESSIRSEVFVLLSKILDCQELPTGLVVEIYVFLCESLKFEAIDKDMKYFLMCFHCLVKYSELTSLEKSSNYPLNQLLFKIFQKITQRYNNDELDALIICLVTDCLKIDVNLFPWQDLDFLLDATITKAIMTNNSLLIEAFVDFLNIFLDAKSPTDGLLYSIISLLGCANALGAVDNNQLSYQVFDKLLLIEKSNKILPTLCDVIKRGSDSVYKHRIGNRSTVGCLRFLCYVLKYIGLDGNKGIIVTNFFHKNSCYILNSLIVVSKTNDSVLSIEILKFIVEVLEKPYTVNGYYLRFIETNTFWELLFLFQWKSTVSMSFSYKFIMNELFNKLQNLDLQPFYTKKLIGFFANNYEILSSYNISFILDYYSQSCACVCGSPNWKTNSTNVVYRYYSTSPAEVMKLLKEALFYCSALKIDEPSMTFYINLICYDCVLGLDFQLEDEILDHLTDVIASLEENLYKKVVDDYVDKILDSKDVNISTINMALLFLTLKVGEMNNATKITYLLGKLIQLVDGSMLSDKKVIFMNSLMFLTRIRAYENDGKVSFTIFEIKSQQLNNEKLFSKNDEPTNLANQDADTKMNESFGKVFASLSFERSLNPYFKRGKSLYFECDFDPSGLLQLYIKILLSTNDWQKYFLSLKHLKYQLLNTVLFQGSVEEMRLLVKLLIKQMQNNYKFGFKMPKWLTFDHIRLAIIDVLYGLFPYKSLLPVADSIGIITNLTIDKHFSDITRGAFFNFLGCSLYEQQQPMQHFIVPILELIKSDLLKPETLMTSLEFIANFLGLEQRYNPLDDEQASVLITGILKRMECLQEIHFGNHAELIRCVKVFSKLLLQQFMWLKSTENKNEIEKPDYFIKTDVLVNFIFVDDNSNFLKQEYTQLYNLFWDHDNPILVMPNIHTLEIKNTKELYLQQREPIKVIFCGRNIKNEEFAECKGTKIIISQVEENGNYCNILGSGNRYLNSKSIVISKTAFVKAVKVMIELAALSAT